MGPRPPLEVVPSLSFALVAASIMPLLLLDRDLRIVAASVSFCWAFGINPAKISGSLLRELGEGEWDIQQLVSLLNATAKGYAKVESYEMDFQRRGCAVRQLVLNAQKIDYDEEENVRLVLSVADVTDARDLEKSKEALAREKDILLQELHHRVANSLQIIASVLMQSAKKVQSEETRIHLVDAHQRVMSVAALQKQLAVTRLGDVELRPYFTALCKSIAASLIADRSQVSLDVTTDDSITTADTSVSLGLIVTELAINALKHAFPDGSGRIMVNYQARGGSWTLSVKDDGVGIYEKPDNSKPGLGTGIVQALANQLGAKVSVESSKTGTKISIAHASVPTLVAKTEQAGRAV